MATKLYFVDNGADTPAAGAPIRGTNEANLRGTASTWHPQGVRTTPGSGANAQSTSSVAGPIAGIEVNGSSPVEFVTEPLAADVTISGTVTFNLWGLESSMTINAGFMVVIERLDTTGAVVSTIVSSAFGTELGTSESVNNWTAAPTSTVVHKGERLRIRIAYKDAGGTMAAGASSLSLTTGAATSGVDGDSWVQFTETVTFLQSDPAGSKLYLTNTGAGINPGASTELEAWTSAGVSSQSAITNSATGYTAPIQITDTGGGTTLEWYSKSLTAFTLAGMVKFNVRAAVSSGAPGGPVIRCEVAVCANDGSSPTVWGASGASSQAISGTDGAFSIYVAGQDVAVSNGQRLRFRIYIDDGVGAMASGGTITVSYNNNSVGAAGDTYAILPQSVTEFSSSVSDVPGIIDRRTPRRRTLQRM